MCGVALEDEAGGGGGGGRIPWHESSLVFLQPPAWHIVTSPGASLVTATQQTLVPYSIFIVQYLLQPRPSKMPTVPNEAVKMLQYNGDRI